MSRRSPRRDLRAFSREPDRAQVTWAHLPAGRLTVSVAPPSDDRRRGTDFARGMEDEGYGGLTVAIEEGPGALVVGGLRSGEAADLRVAVTADDGGPAVAWRGEVAGLAPPPGRELFRFATISDLHLGDTCFGYLGTIRERPPPHDPFPVRAARAAIDELGAWGAQMLVLKGDITQHASAAEWDTLAALLERYDGPVLGTPGNHDQADQPTGRHHGDGPGPDVVDAGAGLSRAGIDSGLVQVADVDGLRLVLGDTNRPGHKSGRVGHIASDLLDAVADADRPVLVVLHHQLMTAPVPTYLPVGIRHGEARPFLDALARARPATLVTSGHTHRHRRRPYGPLTLTEVGSTKDYPGTWAGYVVHEGGIRQVVNRIAAPDVMAWTERTGAAALGAWRHWSPGRLDDRCFSLTWPTP